MLAANREQMRHCCKLPRIRTPSSAPLNCWKSCPLQLYQIQRRLPSVSLTTTFVTYARDDQPVASDAEIVLAGHRVADYLQLFARKFDKLVAHLAVQMVVLRVAVVMLVNGQAA